MMFLLLEMTRAESACAGNAGADGTRKTDIDYFVIARPPTALPLPRNSQDLGTSR
jgi:hypothetical protein